MLWFKEALLFYFRIIYYIIVILHRKIMEEISQNAGVLHNKVTTWEQKPSSVHDSTLPNAWNVISELCESRWGSETTFTALLNLCFATSLMQTRRSCWLSITLAFPLLYPSGLCRFWYRTSIVASRQLCLPPLSAIPNTPGRVKLWLM